MEGKGRRDKGEPGYIDESVLDTPISYDYLSSDRRLQIANTYVFKISYSPNLSSFGSACGQHLHGACYTCKLYIILSTLKPMQFISNKSG